MYWPEGIECVANEILTNTLPETEYRLDVCRAYTDN
jgi:hypothetical protein